MAREYPSLWKQYVVYWTNGASLMVAKIDVFNFKVIPTYQYYSYNLHSNLLSPYWRGRERSSGNALFLLPKHKKYCQRTWNGCSPFLIPSHFGKWLLRMRWFQSKNLGKEDKRLFVSRNSRRYPYMLSCLVPIAWGIFQFITFSSLFQKMSSECFVKYNQVKESGHRWVKFPSPILPHS